MSEKRPPRWKMPTAERETARAQTGPPVPEMYDELGQVTPPPIQITPQMAWEHSTNVARRTADALTEIAHSSGVGLTIADELAICKSDSTAIKKTLKWWQALVLAALGAAGSALFGVARGLYAQGEKSGVVEMRLQACERQTELNRGEIESLRDLYTQMLRDRAWHRNSNTENQR